MPSTISSKMSNSLTLSSADAFADVNPEALSFDKLGEEVLPALLKANLLLSLENEIFEDKLSRESPDLLTGMSAILEEAPMAPAEHGDGPGPAPGPSLTAQLAQPSQPEDYSISSSSEAPSQTTRGLPSAQPSALLSAQPSRQPSLHPSAQPSRQPSTRPSAAQPSRQPSGQSSAQPSGPASKVALSSASDLASLRSKSKTGSLERVPRMSYSQRIAIAEEAQQLAEQRAHNLRRRGEEEAVELRAATEEANARMVETRVSRHTLETQVAVATGTSRAVADKFCRYMSDCIKAAEANIERFRLKTASLRTHHKRVLADIAVKKQLGEALRPVDFEKARIEIDEYNRKIESKGQHLIDLKNISGSATGRLLWSKRRLSELSKQVDGMRRDTATKRTQIAALELEERKVLEDVARADLALNAIRLRMERYASPDVLVYVRLKQDLDALRRDVIVWARRCKIQQQTSRDLRKRLRLQPPPGPGTTPRSEPRSRSSRRPGETGDDAGSTTDASIDGRRAAPLPTATARRRRPQRGPQRSTSSARSRSRGSPGSESDGSRSRSTSCPDTSHSSQ